SSVGPIAMQVHWLIRERDKKQPHQNLEDYRDELVLLYRIMEQQLGRTEFLTGDYSIADMAAYPWVFRHRFQGIDMAEFPSLTAGLARVAARPAVVRGMNIPPRFDGM